MGFYTRRALIQGLTEYESDALPTEPLELSVIDMEHTGKFSATGVTALSKIFLFAYKNYIKITKFFHGACLRAGFNFSSSVYTCTILVMYEYLLKFHTRFLHIFTRSCIKNASACQESYMNLVRLLKNYQIIKELGKSYISQLSCKNVIYIRGVSKKYPTFASLCLV